MLTLLARRIVLPAILFFLSFFALEAHGVHQAQGASEPTNVILIMADDK